MNKRTYWAILLNPLFLILYGYGLSVVFKFCKYGGVARRLPIIAAIFLVGVLWILVWSIIYFALKRKSKHSTNEISIDKTISKTTNRSRNSFVVLFCVVIELTAFFLLSGFYGYKIYGTTELFSGKLGNYLYDRKTTKKISLTDDDLDFTKYGLNKIIAKLPAKCGLDANAQLYAGTTLVVKIDGNGTIHALDVLLYSFDDDNTTNTWLLSYDSSKDDRLFVYMDPDGTVDSTYKEQEQMAPFFTMMNAAVDSNLFSNIMINKGNDSEDEDLDKIIDKDSYEDSKDKNLDKNPDEDSEDKNLDEKLNEDSDEDLDKNSDENSNETLDEDLYILRYKGYIESAYNSLSSGGWYIVDRAYTDKNFGSHNSSDSNGNFGSDDDSDSAGNYGSDNNYDSVGNYNSDNNSNGDAYTVISSENYNGAVLNSFIDAYTITISKEDYTIATIAYGIGTSQTADDIEASSETKSEISDAKNNGKTLVTDDDGMTFYLDDNTSMRLSVVDAAAGSRAYEFSGNGIYNADPFNGRWGVAESIYFIDEKTGFILISTASQDSSEMYYTSDGGEHFSEVTLPTSDGDADMTGNEFGYTSEDMDYIYTPYEEDGALYVYVSYDYSGKSSMSTLFLSRDNGQSWEYVSYSENL